MKRESFYLKLLSTIMITPTVLEMEFIRDDKQYFSFIPGQFITFHFHHAGLPYQRSYSVASIPGQTSTIQIAVSPFKGGPATEFLFGMKPGETVETTGPFGRLILREEQLARYILVATGTGVTPYRAMLPELSKRIANLNLNVILLLGVQTPSDLLYGKDFITFEKANPNFKFRAYYSRELPASPQPYEYKGYVQSAFAELKLEPTRDIIYLCGNPNMIDQAFMQLLEIGFATSNVRREKYISPKK